MTKNEKLFHKAVYFYIDYFGLYEYSITIAPMQSRYNKATTSFNALSPSENGLVYEIEYDTEWINSADSREVYKIAFHEVWETILLNIRSYANNTELVVSKRSVDEAVHRVILLLENTVFDLIKRDK